MCTAMTYQTEHFYFGRTLDYDTTYGETPKGDQSWVFIGRTDVEAETPVLWPPDAKS